LHAGQDRVVRGNEAALFQSGFAEKLHFNRNALVEAFDGLPVLVPAARIRSTGAYKHHQQTNPRIPAHRYLLPVQKKTIAMGRRRGVAR
jgi:hypothetical protein